MRPAWSITILRLLGGLPASRTRPVRNGSPGGVPTSGRRTATGTGTGTGTTVGIRDIVSTSGFGTGASRTGGGGGDVGRIGVEDPCRYAAIPPRMRMSGNGRKRAT